MDVTGWIRKCVHAILIITLMWIMYENLLKWSQGQTNISFIPSSATTLPYPSVTICPYNISDSIEDIDSIRGENRLLRLNHVVDNVLDSFDLKDSLSFKLRKTRWKKIYCLSAWSFIILKNPQAQNLIYLIQPNISNNCKKSTDFSLSLKCCKTMKVKFSNSQHGNFLNLIQF